VNCTGNLRIPWLILLALMTPVALVLTGGAAEPGPEIIRVGITQGSMDGPAVNDAKAATKVWMESIFSEQVGHAVQPEVQLYANRAAVKEALERKGADLLVMGTADFYALGGSATFDRVFLYSRGGEVAERYLLLVRADSSIESLANVRGRKLILLDSVRADLAERWLNSRLKKNGLPVVRQLAEQVLSKRKSSSCIQRVFFRNADACLVTAQAYRTAVELNPQLGRQLTVLAKSPPYVPSVIAIPANFTAAVWPTLEQGILTAHARPKGQQVLRVYRIDRLVRQSGEELASAKALLAETGEAGDDAKKATTASHPTTTEAENPQ